MSKMVMVTVGGPYINCEREYETDLTVDEWNDLSDEEKSQIVDEIVFEYAEAHVHTDDGESVDW